MYSINQSEKTKILIIDDCPEAVRVLGNTLPNHYKRQVALSGKNAFELLNLSEELPDLILLDVMMKDMSGYEVCKKLKADVRFKKIPVIFISALNDTFDKVKAFEVGGVDYIIKPFHREEVMARINTHLEIVYSRKEIYDLYSKTLNGTVRAIHDMLTIVNPDTARTSNAIRQYSEMIMKELSIKETWDLKIACLLSGIGMLTETIENNEIRYFTNINKTNDSRKIKTIYNIEKAYSSLEISINVIENIPKLEPIVKIIRNSMLPLNEEELKKSALDLEPDLLKGHILRILLSYYYRIKLEKNYFIVLKQMKEDQCEGYSHEVLDALNKIQNEMSKRDILEVKINKLESKMILVDDVHSLKGKLLLKSGCEISDSIIIKLYEYNEFRKGKTIRVIKEFGEFI